MRLFGFKGPNGYESVGAVTKGNQDIFIDLCATDMLIPNSIQEIIQSPAHMDRVHDAIANPKVITGKLNTITFKAPIERPGKIVCMGLNYADHAKEGGNARPEYPSFFYARS
ncbi:hypothetical protein [Polynucleobacter campilacus]|uniref:hypothetical protein n=1 Tax=Polynucleobacter campilacus TaxID=1743163 RepID=UPI003B82D078